MGLRSSPLAYTILPSSAGGLGLFQSNKQMEVSSNSNYGTMIKELPVQDDDTYAP